MKSIFTKEAYCCMTSSGYTCGTRLVIQWSELTIHSESPVCIDMFYEQGLRYSILWWRHTTSCSFPSKSTFTYVSSCLPVCSPAACFHRWRRSRRVLLVASPPGVLRSCVWLELCVRRPSSGGKRCSRSGRREVSQGPDLKHKELSIWGKYK